MADRTAYPDDSLLKQIFTTNQPKTISIFLQNWDKCVFKAEFSEGLEDRHSACVVRLEALDKDVKRLTTIAAIQQIAATVLPDLVPQTVQVGKAKNAQGRWFQFSVTEFVQGELLQNVWQQMCADDQSSVVTELVQALEKLHSIQLSDKLVKDVLEKTLREEGDEDLKILEQPGAFGGPQTGFLNDGAALLEAIVEGRKVKKSFCTVTSNVVSADVRIQSNFEELGSVVINTSDIDEWPEEAVLCHNDTNPRNLILQSRDSSDGRPRYKLSGIIDWEFAGFYPASYELSLQDEYLGGSHQHVSFYLLLKESMKNIVPRSSSQLILLQAMELIFESQQRLLLDGTNISAHIRKRIIEISKLARGDDPYVGWIRSPQDGAVPEFSSASLQKLEDDVIEEMLARRKSKTTPNPTVAS